MRFLFNILRQKESPKQGNGKKESGLRPKLRQPRHKPISLSWNVGELRGQFVLSLILEASRDGDLEQVKAHFDSNPDLLFNKASYCGTTPLHMAAETGHKDLATLLLSKNADVDARNKSGATPLHVAAAHGQVDVVELLLSNGADVDSRDKYGATPLHLASGKAHTKVVNSLLARNSDVNAGDDNGATPLHYAARETYVGKFFLHHHVVESLLARNADVNSTDKEHQTPLHMAASKGSRDMVKLLLVHNATLNANSYGSTPLNYAIAGGHTDVVALLHQHGGAAATQQTLFRKGLNAI